MGTSRFTPEFKEEAVRQVVDRGYPVAQVPARLRVSAHSLYKWVKAIKPDKAEKHAAELIEAKSEILKLRAQLRRMVSSAPHIAGNHREKFQRLEEQARPGASAERARDRSTLTMKQSKRRIMRPVARTAHSRSSRSCRRPDWRSTPCMRLYPSALR